MKPRTEATAMERILCAITNFTGFGVHFPFQKVIQSTQLKHWSSSDPEQVAHQLEQGLHSAESKNVPFPHTVSDYEFEEGS